MHPGTWFKRAGERGRSHARRPPNVPLTARIGVKLVYQRLSSGRGCNCAADDLSPFHAISIHSLVPALIRLDDRAVQADTGEYSLGPGIRQNLRVQL